MRTPVVVFCGSLLTVLSCMVSTTRAFQTPQSLMGATRSVERRNTARLFMSSSYYTSDRGRRSYGQQGVPERSKRQERVGRVVATELSLMVHSGNIKGDADFLDTELRQRISVVHVDVSPDLRQARVTVSIRDGKGSSSAAVDKRRAFSWLVQNNKPLRHTLAQRLSHMKVTPNLTFVQADVAAAVDVMYLIDKVSSGYKRQSVDESLPEGVLNGIDFDADDSDDDWEDIDDEGLFQA